MPARCTLTIRSSTCYLDDGYLVYEYNLMINERFIAKTTRRLAAGKHTIVVGSLTCTGSRPPQDTAI